MSHITSRSEDLMYLKDQADSSSSKMSNSSQRTRRDKTSLKKGTWTSAEDAILAEYVRTHGDSNWVDVHKKSGLSRCGKSCRLRWVNHLRPNLKKGAFTLEEERLIIELHSKFGNKWAQMVTHLPGRTDNEIKNYWNTRIKRCQRAGLPIYPSDLHSQTLNENMQVQVTDEFNSPKPRNQGSQETNYDIPGVISEHFQGNKGHLSLSPTLSYIPSVSSMITWALDPSQKDGLQPSTPPAKRLRPETIPHNFSFGANGLRQFDQFQKGTFENIGFSTTSTFPYDFDPNNKNLAPYNEMHTTPTFLSNNLSASILPQIPSNLELPLLQYPYNYMGDWKVGFMQPNPPDNFDAFPQSPFPTQTPYEPLLSNYSSPRNSGLLDSLVYNDHFLNNTNNLSFEKISSPYIHTPNDILDNSTLDFGDRRWEEYIDQTFPLDHFVASVCSGRDPVRGECSSQEQQALKSLTGSYVQSEPAEQVVTSDIMKESTENNKHFLDKASTMSMGEMNLTGTSTFSQ